MGWWDELWDNPESIRRTLGGGALIIGGVVAAPFTGGTSLIATQAGLNMIISGEEAEQAREDADAQAAAQQTLNEARMDAATVSRDTDLEAIEDAQEQTQFEFQQSQDAYGQAVEDINFALDIAREEYQAAQDQVGRERNRGYQTLGNSRSAARGQLGAFGGRGGSVFQSLERTYQEQRSDLGAAVQQQYGSLTRQMSQREQAAQSALFGADEALETAEQRREQTLANLSRRETLVGSQFDLAGAGFEYNSQMTDFQRQQVYDATRYSTLTGALEGLQSGFQIASFASQMGQDLGMQWPSWLDWRQN